MNAKSELPKLRDGVTWRNPQNIPLAMIPDGYRLLTSVETTIPAEAKLSVTGGAQWSFTSRAGRNILDVGHATSHIVPALLPAAALPEPTNPPAEFPKLRTGVTYRNPEGARPEHIPPGYRLLTSVESEVPADAETPATYAAGSVSGPWKSAFGQGMLVQINKFTYRTRTPFPAAALPVVEAQLPAGVRWLGKPLDQESLDTGWRRLCTADTALTIPDVGCNSTDGNGFIQPCLSQFDSVIGELSKWGQDLWWFRTKAPLPEFNKRPEFPALPAGVEWVNLQGLTPADVGVSEGWRPLCTLDNSRIPADAEAFKGTPKIWRPSNKRGDHIIGSRYVAYRTKNPIPELSWPELPAGESYFNPQNLTPADLGFGYRPLCTLDEEYPADHEYRQPFSGDWVRGLRTSYRPSGATFGKTYRTKVPIPTKPISTPVSSAVYPDSVAQQRIDTLTAELNAAKEEVRKAGESLVSFACKTTDYQSALYQILQLTGGPATVEEVGCDIAAVALARVTAQMNERNLYQDQLKGLQYRLDNAIENARRLESNAHTQTESLRDLERQNQYLRDSREKIIKISQERRHALRQINEIIDGNLDPSDAHLTATARKVAALDRVKTAAEFQVADLEKANAAQTEVLDTIAKLVGDTEGTLQSILPAVCKAVLDEPDRKFQIAVQDIEACQRIHGDLPGHLNEAMSHAFYVAANIVRRVSKA